MRLRIGLIGMTAIATVATSAVPTGAALHPRFPLGTDARKVDLRDAPGIVEYGDGYAVPLTARRPSWYTDKLHRQVLAADGIPVAAPNDAPLPGEVGIRPGSWMVAPASCTMNFVFGSSGELAIGTAGHCVDKLGDSVVLLTVAPGGENPVLVDIGTVIARHENGVGDDFALVAIKPALYPWVSPTIAAIGGPCGQFFGSGIQVVEHYGHGVAIGTGGTARGGVAATYWTTDEYGFDGAAIFGDSGSAVRLNDFKAVGDLTHVGLDLRGVPTNVFGTRIGKINAIASGWTMLDSPFCL